MLGAPPGPLAPGALWAAWSFAPAIIVPLEVTALLYLCGVWNAWQRAGAGHGIGRRRCVCFVGAMLALVAALVSPLDALSAALFSAHMAQHLILMMVAAPLLVASDLPQALLWALPRGWAGGLARWWNRARHWRAAWRRLSGQASAWLCFTLALWLWHTPLLFEAALQHAAIHMLEHVCFLLAAVLFWQVLLRRNGPDHLRFGRAIPYLFTTTLQTNLLGALMTFTLFAWYSDYAAGALSWGLTPLQDQQLAGLIMWLPGGAVFSGLTIGYFAAWLRALEQRSQGPARREALAARPDQAHP